LQSDGVSPAELARQASVLEAACDPTCVDLYFAATCRRWQEIATLGDRPAKSDVREESRTYNAYLAKLIVTAQRFHRLDPTTGLQVFDNGQPLTVRVDRYGFRWTAEDFNELELVGDYRVSTHGKAIRNDGLGVPLVVQRCRPTDEQFFRREQPFAATAVLRTRGACADARGGEGSIGTSNEELVLEFYNPAYCTHLHGASERWVLAGDITAPLAWTASKNPNSPVTAFLRPQSTNAKAQLVMLSPYQPGKIPLVFVHGLLSDPTTWLTLGNSLSAQTWFRQRYQVWVFRYPSGVPFLVSAATLRRELNAALAASPEAAADPAASQMVLVGHSMGGLIAKLQVTDSGSSLWNLAANRPLDQIVASDADREQLQEVFFFSPQPFIRKVIFIGTPHRGASMATRGVGRITSLAARTPLESNERYRRVLADNPGVFAPWLARRVPTSIDMLEPGHPLLVGIERLPVAPDVQLHSIIGVADKHQLGGPGDGVVLMTSAQHPGVVSERLVSDKHKELHESASTSIEIERILERQLSDYDAWLRSTEVR
jgi:pimeloyl-ACP methyl ester carboxylesterase